MAEVFLLRFEESTAEFVGSKSLEEKRFRSFLVDLLNAKLQPERVKMREVWKHGSEILGIKVVCAQCQLKTHYLKITLEADTVVFQEQSGRQKEQTRFLKSKCIFAQTGSKTSDTRIQDTPVPSSGVAIVAQESLRTTLLKAENRALQAKNQALQRELLRLSFTFWRSGASEQPQKFQVVGLIKSDCLPYFNAAVQCTRVFVQDDLSSGSASAAAIITNWSTCVFQLLMLLRLPMIWRIQCIVLSTPSGSGQLS